MTDISIEPTAPTRIYAMVMADTMARGTGGRLNHAHDADRRGTGMPALCGARPGTHGMVLTNYKAWVLAPDEDAVKGRRK